VDKCSPTWAVGIGVLLPRKEVMKMSIRAYRVVQIVTAKPNSFNLYQDTKLVNFLDTEYGFYESMTEGTGLTEVPVEALERAVAEVEMDDEVKEALKKDIAVARAKGEEYVQYYCY